MGPTGRWAIDDARMEAAGAVDAQTRPPLLGKPQNGFPQAPTRIPSEDISIELREGTFLTSFDKSRAGPLTQSG